MAPGWSFPRAAGHVINFKIRVSYTVEMGGTGYSVWAWAKPVEGLVLLGDHLTAILLARLALARLAKNNWHPQTTADRLMRIVL
jgi:hypothetical protein